MSLRPGRVRFEHLGADVLGIGDARPRLSWDLDGEQVAYELRIVDSGSGASSTFLIESADRVLVPWPGKPLHARDRLDLSVRVRAPGGVLSDWSEPSFVEAGIDRVDWAARFVSAPSQRASSLPLLRSPEVALEFGVVSARLYVSAHGMYEVELNGQRVGDDVLAPGWQSYHHRLAYRTHDVTELARGSRRVVVGALLADGWYRGRLGFPLIMQDRVYGTELALLAQLELVLEDGSRVTVATGEDWVWHPGPVVSSDLYDGETFDARRAIGGWSRPGAVLDWLPVEVGEVGGADLVCPTGPPVRRVGGLPVIAVTRSAAGNPIVDFGQNLVGRLRLNVRGSAGDTVEVRHAEVLDGGELSLAPLRTARATDRYTLGSADSEVWEPRFTYHGFRYAELIGWPGEFNPDDVTAVIIHSDMERTGWFECSNAQVNRLHENVVWSLRGNFVDIPTDCPQRDERLGWTGDLTVFAPTAAFLYEVGGLLRSWLDDLAREQHPDGTVPFWVPGLPIPPEVSQMPGLRAEPTAVWGDAAVAVPMALYEAYGDVGILAAQFPSMRLWVDRILAEAGAEGVWDTGFQFGDWLDPSAPPEAPGAALTETALVATAYVAHSTSQLAAAAAALGDAALERQYAAEAERIRAAFRDRFARGGRLTSDTQTAYALALMFDLVRDRGAAGSRLVELVRAHDHRIATGFVGTPLILPALTAAGYVDDAYAMLLQKDCPSWLYTVGMGATTIWERWDSMLPDGRINPGEMTSFNHYAFGSVAAWLHGTVAGLSPLEPGYRKVRIAPRPGGELTWARAAHRSAYGLIEVSWQAASGGWFELDVTIPPGVTGVLDVRGAEGELAPGTHRIRLLA